MKQIPLSQGLFALVDDEDFDWLNQFKWCAAKDRRNVYAVRSVKLPSGKWGLIRMHNFILGVKEVDHENGNGVDNQRHNLRPATTAENGRAFKRKWVGASSKFRGVCWATRDRKWKATIQGKHLGYFSCEKAAAKVYDAAARKRFGAFASPNFL